MSGYFQILRNRNYALYFFGQVFSLSGSWMQSVVMSWLVYRMSGSGAWLGIINFCTHLPALLVSPYAGVIADKKDRRKILLWAELLAMFQAFALVALVYTNQIQLWHLAALSVLLGMVNAFDMTTRHAFAVDMVGKEQLPKAIVMNTTMIQGSRILGPALAGFFIAWVGEAMCFAINGFSYLAIIFALLLMRVQRPRLKLVDPLEATRSVNRQIADGMNYILRTPEIANLLLITFFIALAGVPLSVLLPIVVKEGLGGGAQTLGWMTSIHGLGAVPGALAGVRIATYQMVKRRSLNWILWMGVSIAIFGASGNYWVSVVSIFFAGFFNMGIYPLVNNSIQNMVDDSMRGRVSSVYIMTFMAAAPIGSIIAGYLADHAGAHTVIVAIGMMCVAFAAFGRKARSPLRNLTARARARGMTPTSAPK